MSSNHSLVSPDLDLVKGVSAEDRAALHAIFTDLRGAADRIQRAAQKWVQLSQKTRDRVIEGLPTTWRSFMERLQRVGEGSLHPQLYAAYGRAAYYLGRLPLEDQTRYLQELIPVAITKGGKADIQYVDVEDMSDEQRRQVFKVTGDVVQVRSVEDQRVYLANLKRRQDREEEIALGNVDRIDRPGRWRVEKGRVYLSPGKLTVGLTERDVRLMMRDLGMEDKT